MADDEEQEKRSEVKPPKQYYIFGRKFEEKHTVHLYLAVFLPVILISWAGVLAGGADPDIWFFLFFGALGSVLLRFALIHTGFHRRGCWRYLLTVSVSFSGMLSVTLFWTLHAFRGSHEDLLMMFLWISYTVWAVVQSVIVFKHRRRVQTR